MPAPKQPTREEIRETARRLCKALRIRTPDPVTADSLQRIAEAHEPSPNRRERGCGHALRACAEELSRLEKQQARDPLLQQLVEAECAALEAAAASQRDYKTAASAFLANARKAEYADGNDLVKRAVLAFLRCESPYLTVLFQLRNVLRDNHLSTDLPFAVTINPAPLMIRLAKILKTAGCGIPEIASLTVPSPRGTSRRQAINTVRKRLKAKASDTCSYTAPDTTEVTEHMEAASAAWLGAELPPTQRTV